MNELVVIKKAIIGTEEVNSVSARELYEQLGLDKAHWSRWSKQNIIENTFAMEHDDWEGFTIMVNGNETTEFALSIDFAKKLAMQVKTEQGERVRNYFIACEKKLKEVVREISEKPKEIPHWSIEANGIEHVLGMLKAPAHIIASEMVKHVLNVGGPDLRGTVKELPCCQNLKESDIYLEPTALGKRFGISAKEMNKKLRDMDLQYHNGDSWTPTEKGEQFSSLNHCSSERNSWSGYNYRWNFKAINQMIKEI